MPQYLNDNNSNEKLVREFETSSEPETLSNELYLPRIFETEYRKNCKS